MRHWFGQSPSDWTFSVGDGDVAVLEGGVQVTAWSAAEGGIQYEDLLDAGGVATSSVTTGDGSAPTSPLGMIPRFQGPDQVVALWADAGGGVRYLMTATDIGDIIPVAESTSAQLATHVATGNPHSTPLGDLIDVNAPTPGDGQILAWDVDTERWVPITIAGVSNSVTLDTLQTLIAAKIWQLAHGNTTDTYLKLRFSGVREEAASVLLAEWNQGSEGAPNWRRTFELNEYGMVRVTAPVVPQTIMRLRADPSNTAAAFEVTDLSNVPKMWIESTDGRIRAPNMDVVPAFAKAGTIAASVGAHRWYNDTGAGLTIRSVRASVGTPPTGQSLIVDVHKNGSTIFSTQANRPTIAAGASTSGAVTAINTTTIAAGEYLTVDVDQVGSGTAGADLTVQILAY